MRLERIGTAEEARDQGAILVIRLGALGDILHALPAVASLKLSFPRQRIVWLVARKWIALLAGNPFIDEILPFEREGVASFRGLRRVLRVLEPEVAIDFQGLVQSALAGRMARPKRFYGFDRSVAREPLAAWLYSDRIHVTGPHRIERNLQLVAAAGAEILTEKSFIPAGVPEGNLPGGPFVIASPFAGWGTKQWPLENYVEVGKRLRKEGLELLLNVPEERGDELGNLENVRVHSSSLEGLIYATRQAIATVGVDSGPLHLAAALGKPGVALFGPTDPAQTGPFKSPMKVLRKADVETTYKRGRGVHESMAAISPDEVCRSLVQSLAAARV